MYCYTQVRVSETCCSAGTATTANQRTDNGFPVTLFHVNSATIITLQPSTATVCDLNACKQNDAVGTLLLPNRFANTNWLVGQ